MALVRGTERKQPRNFFKKFKPWMARSCAEFYSRFRAFEETQHELLTDKLSLLYFELAKLPDSVDVGDELTSLLFLG